MQTGQLELRWVASCSASALRAARYVTCGRSAAAELQTVLSGPAARLQDELATLPAPAEQLWRHLLPLAAGIEGNRELADVLLRKTCGDRRVAARHERLGESIGEVERTFMQLFPSCAEDLVLRGRPLREQWEARGPGLLRQLAALTEPDLLVERADVILVQPISGGGGEAHLSYNCVHIEAVLANPQPELPEVVRLAWLLAQLQLDLPRFSEPMSPLRLAQVAGLALIPPVLNAAQYVELSEFSETNVGRAIAAWCPAEHVPTTTATVMDWWYTYEQSRPGFAVALQGLEKMLAS